MISLTRRMRICIAAGLVLALAGGTAGYRSWRHARDRELVRTGRPPLPGIGASTSRPLAERIAACDALLAEGRDVPASLVELSQLYHANGYIPEAVQCYRLLMQVDSGNARWPHLLATLVADYGRLAEAAPLWQRATQLAPGYEPAGIRLGDAWLKLNDFAAADAAYRRVLALPGDHPHALVGLARIDLHFARRAAAQEKLETAVRQTRAQIGADLLTTVYEESGQGGRAVELRGRGKSSGSYSDPADPWLDELLANCYDVYRLQIAGGVAEHRGDPALGETLLRQALALAPENTDTICQLGMLQLHQGNLPAAHASFVRCTELRPDFSDGWAQLIGTQRRLGYSAALPRTIATALAHCPTSAGLLLERGRQLSAAGRHPEAMADYRESIRLRPEEATAYLELAQTLFQLGRIADGVSELRRGLVAEPDQPMILTTLAMSAIVQNDRHAADEWLRRAYAQSRVPPSQLQQLAGQYAVRFGHYPPPAAQEKEPN